MKFFKKFFVFILILNVLVVVNCKARISLKSIKVGSSWKYIIYIERFGTQTMTGEMEISVSPWRKLGDQEVLPFKGIFSSGAQTAVVFTFYAEDKHGIYTYAEQGLNDIEPKIVQGKKYDIKYPLKKGNSWSYSNDQGEDIQYCIVGKEEITVPAGNFECYKVEAKGKTKIEGETRDFKSYRWMDSKGIEIKSYTEYELYNIQEKLIAGGKSFKFKIISQLLSVNEEED